MKSGVGAGSLLFRFLELEGWTVLTVALRPALGTVS